MAITIQITGILDDHWLDDETASEVSDEYIIELIHEDIGDFVNNAGFRVSRDGKPYGDAILSLWRDN